MKNRHLLVTLLVSIAAPTVTIADTITLDDGGVTFEAPERFKPLSQEVIDVKFPSKSAPKYVIGNETAATTIAYDIKPHNVPEDKIDEVRESFSQTFPRMIPGLVWKENKLITISGKKWGYLEMTSSAIDTDIYNVMLFTSYKGKLLAFNFNSTKKEFPKYEQALRESIKSIKVK